MPRNDRQLRVRQFAVDDVQIGAADAAGRDLDQDVAALRRGHRPLAPYQRRAGPLQDHGAHEGHDLNLVRRMQGAIAKRIPPDPCPSGAIRASRYCALPPRHFAGASAHRCVFANTASRLVPRSLSMTAAALRPGPAEIEPPGWVVEPVW